MKVRCRLCEHEKNGFCSKKSSTQKPVKIQLNKPRTCSLFKEDGMRVLMDYRKREAHKSNVKKIQSRNIMISETIAQAQKDLAARKESLATEVPATQEVDNGEV